MRLPICASMWLMLVMGSFIKVNFIFLKENEGKLQILGLHSSSRPLGECSQGAILVSLLFFSVSLAISVRVLRFNNSLKSESSGAPYWNWQAGSLGSDSCCWQKGPFCRGTLPGGTKEGFFSLWKEHRLNLLRVWGKNLQCKNVWNFNLEANLRGNQQMMPLFCNKKLKLQNFTITSWLKEIF